jgi:hypothetical protein
MNIKRRYFNLKNAGAISGLTSFLANNKYKDKKEVTNALQELKTYSLHKPQRHIFKRRPVMCPTIDYMWQADLIVYKDYSRQNHGFRNILITVDCLSKMIFTEPLKSKTAQSVHDGLLVIFKRSKRSPSKIQSDFGGEFWGGITKNMLAARKITLYKSFSKLKASVVERYVRRVKSVIARNMTHRNTKNWVDYLQDITTSINNSFNRSILMAPSKASKINESLVWHNLYDKVIKAKVLKPKYVVGQNVRISRGRILFRKGYEETYSREIFRIRAITMLRPIPVYILEDLKGERLEGSGFYEQELTPVSTNENTD